MAPPFTWEDVLSNRTGLMGDLELLDEDGTKFRGPVLQVVDEGGMRRIFTRWMAELGKDGKWKSFSLNFCMVDPSWPSEIDPRNGCIIFPVIPGALVGRIFAKEAGQLDPREVEGLVEEAAEESP